MATSCIPWQPMQDKYGWFTVISQEDPGPSWLSPPEEFNTTFQFLPSDLDPQMKQENIKSEVMASDPPTEPPTETPPVPTNNLIDLLQQLVQGLVLLGWAAPMPPTLVVPPTNVTCICTPNTFNGTNPNDLWPFLLQCQLTFSAYPQQFMTDLVKVCFATSYLKKSALKWFKNGIMETNPRLAPVWCTNWSEYVKELCMHFGSFNPVSNAEDELGTLTMSYLDWILEYLIKFNMLVSQVAWGNAALWYQFYKGLPDQLKDWIMLQGKPETLQELVNIATHHDALYWEWQTEQWLTHQFKSWTSSYLLPNWLTTNWTVTNPPSSSWTQNRMYGQPKINSVEYTCWRDGQLCYTCGKSDHIAQNCPTPRARAVDVPWELQRTPDVPPNEEDPSATGDNNLEN